MENEISKVDAGSIAEEVGIEIGDRLISINDTPVKDLIDYKFLIVDEYVVLEIEKKDKEIWEIEVEKEFSEDIGIEFKSAILDKPKRCHNKCMFCFIDQLPEGMRNTLYFKDDDSRLSFLQGNFITMTNMKDEDIDRIIRYKISPINVSVHTTNPELRVKMLNNRFAGNVYERLKKLANAGITLNCQMVVCPGINNGKELIKTIEDLYKLYPSVKNVAAVPIGITKYREGLCKLTIYNKKSAYDEIKAVENLQKKYMKEIGNPFIRLSDEFYMTADLEIPEADFYGGYEQLEDGIGMVRSFRDNVDMTLNNLKKDISGTFSIPTGVSAFEEINEAIKKIRNRNNNIKIEVFKIKNNFFGETITVAGLLTGIDIINQLKDRPLGKYLIMSDTMFKKGYELGDYKEKIMLDDTKIEDIEKSLGVKVLVCSYTGEDLIDIINNNCKGEK